jgi:hypothetical protein
MMKAVSKFGRSGCFNCTVCGRQTRNTGRGNNGACGLCGHCYEQIVTEEQMANEGETPELLRKRQGYIDACKKAGGSPDENSYQRLKSL